MSGGPFERSEPRPRLVIGLLNNMPDAALLSSERQFGGLLAAAAEAAGAEVELKLFALRDIERDVRARACMDGRYTDASRLGAAGLDGLVVTGNEPRASDLTTEPYWDGLTQAMDWVEATGTPVIWSCLAAHAAALHQAGVQRRSLAAKKSGVFGCHKASGHVLLVDLPETFQIPHSRHNELDEADLVAAGYQILTRCPLAGVDSFVRPGRSLALHFQGHPEYEADTLIREYCRDVGRFLNGERQTHPRPPFGCFDAETGWRLARLATATAARPDPGLMAAYLEIVRAARPLRTWRRPAMALYRGWLEQAAERKGLRLTAPKSPDGRWPRDPFAIPGVRRERRLVPRLSVA